MKSYSEATIFTRREMLLLKQAKQLVGSIPDRQDAADIRCHELARAVGVVLGLTYIDGKFGFVEHTWLSTFRDRGDKENILDVYAVGMMPMVILVDAHHLTLQLPRLYKPSKEARKDIRWDVVKDLEKQLRDLDIPAP